MTAEQKNVVKRTRSIRVDSTVTRPFVLQERGDLTLTPDYIEKSTDKWLAIAIAHDGFHVKQFELGGYVKSTGIHAEKAANIFAIGFARAIGATDEITYLRGLVENPKQLEEFINSDPWQNTRPIGVGGL